MPHVGDSCLKALIAVAIDGIVSIDSGAVIQVFDDVCEGLFHYQLYYVTGCDLRRLATELDGRLASRAAGFVDGATTSLTIRALTRCKSEVVSPSRFRVPFDGQREAA